MFGTVSYLSRTGTSLYASEWTDVVAHASSLWRGILICPLIPLLSAECTGSIVREVCELRHGWSTCTKMTTNGYRTHGRGWSWPWRTAPRGWPRWSPWSPTEYRYQSQSNMLNPKPVPPFALAIRVQWPYSGYLTTTAASYSEFARLSYCKFQSMR